MWSWNVGSTSQKWKFVPYEQPKFAQPTASIPSGTEVEKGTKLILICLGADHIYYTTDGTQPTRNSAEYPLQTGIIINISSDYGIIAPNQSIYRRDGIPESHQIIKPVSYSVVKHGIMGLTKYLAVYWAKRGVRVNTLCPASLENGQNPEFVQKISELIPMGRMSRPDEYVGTVLYMLSDASSYMTGATVVLDGGRTIW
jgi:NAD(P)-dependent dehydrogenase (short-subunit alcohol dehydrogenase family)